MIRTVDRTVPTDVKLVTLLTCLVVWLLGCQGERRPPPGAEHPPADTGFAGVQTRGHVAMGVDQYTSQHVFEDLPDGGRVVLERDAAADSAGIAAIRTHMREIATRFTGGDFSLPGFVHDREVPGTATMNARRSAIGYRPIDRPRGGELRITSSDPAAIAAIHDFLAFQRMDHHAAGHEP